MLNLALTPRKVTKSIKIKRYLLRGACMQKVSCPILALHLTVSTTSFFHDACSSPLHLSNSSSSLLSTGMKKCFRNLIIKNMPFLTPYPLQPPPFFSGGLGYTSPCHPAVTSPLICLWPPHAAVCPSLYLNLPAQNWTQRVPFHPRLGLSAAFGDAFNHSLSLLLVLLASGTPCSPGFLIPPHWLVLLNFFTGFSSSA